MSLEDITEVKQLQILEYIGMFQIAVLFSIFFLGLQCYFFRIANIIMFFFILNIRKGIECLKRQIFRPSTRVQCSAGKCFLHTVRQRFCILIQGQAKLQTLGE